MIEKLKKNNNKKQNKTKKKKTYKNNIYSTFGVSGNKKWNCTSSVKLLGVSETSLNQCIYFNNTTFYCKYYAWII